MNHKDMVKLVRDSALETLGDSSKIVPYLCMAGEDFAEFTHRVPSAFYFVGTGNDSKDTNYPHHHPLFNIDEDTLKIGAEMHIRSALRFLNS